MHVQVQYNITLKIILHAFSNDMDATGKFPKVCNTQIIAYLCVAYLCFSDKYRVYQEKCCWKRRYNVGSEGIILFTSI
jgi:hypothetical protein